MVGSRERGPHMERFLSVADAARLLDLTPARVRQLLRSGDLQAAAETAGGIRLLRRSDVAMLARRRAAKGGPPER